MGRRRTRRGYKQTVVENIGEMDVIDPNAEYIINARGGLIYSDIFRHDFIDICEGAIYDVLSVGIHHKAKTPIATIKVGNMAKVFRLPEEYFGWMDQMRQMSLMGAKLLPAKVEFGKRLDGNYYAELV